MHISQNFNVIHTKKTNKKLPSGQQGSPGMKPLRTNMKAQSIMIEETQRCIGFQDAQRRLLEKTKKKLHGNLLRQKLTQNSQYRTAKQNQIIRMKKS